MRPLGRLTLESDRLRGRIEAIERLAAESRVAAEAQREDEQRIEEELAAYVDTYRQERVTPSPLAANLPHSIGVPLGGADPVGVLALWSAHRACTRDDERLLRGVAPLLALALRWA